MKARRSKLIQGTEILVRKTGVLSANEGASRYGIYKGQIFTVNETVDREAKNDFLVNISKKNKKFSIKIPLFFIRKYFEMKPTPISSSIDDWRVVNWNFEGEQIGWQIVRKFGSEMEIGASYEFRAWQ